MGKTADDEKKRISPDFQEDLSKLKLPIPLPDENQLYKLFRGNHIAIFEGRIIAFDPSIRNIHKKIDNLVSKEKNYHIQWIDEGFVIYGIAL